MTEASEFRQLAEETLCWANQSTTEEEEQSLKELVCTWMQAAYASEHPDADNQHIVAGATSRPCRRRS
jgi:hypothetical protein